MAIGYFWSQVFGYTCIFAVVIGLVRFKKMLKPYRLFVVFVSIGLVSELISTFAILIHRNNIVNANIYVLAEAILLLFLFYEWRSFNRTILVSLVTAVALVWIGENLVFGSITQVNSFFRLFYALIIMTLSIDQINVTMMHERKNLFRNARFIICFLFAFYFAFRATYEVFYFVPLRMSDVFYDRLFDILVYVNLFVNLGYALAALWIPTKQKFTLPY